MYRIGQSTIAHLKKVIRLIKISVPVFKFGKVSVLNRNTVTIQYNDNCLVNFRMYRTFLHPPFLSPSLAIMCVHCEREGVDGDNYGWANKRQHRISRKISSFFANTQHVKIHQMETFRQTALYAVCWQRGS